MHRHALNIIRTSAIIMILLGINLAFDGYSLNKYGTKHVFKNDGSTKILRDVGDNKYEQLDIRYDAVEVDNENITLTGNAKWRMTMPGIIFGLCGILLLAITIKIKEVKCA